LANRLGHPKTVYVKEAAIVPKLDEWLIQLFEPEHIDETCEALTMADGVDEAAEAKAEVARRRIADCDQRLARYRVALDVGADAVVVAGWMAEVQAERERAVRDAPDAPPPEPLSTSQVKKMVLAMKDMLQTLATADPRTKAALYAGLGLKLTYHPDRDVVEVEARPKDACATERVGGGT
jgi:hypothetical protein